ncbi:solute carrier family 22 member 7-like [Rhipicephalus microplus]|uniref:solute carrier family 22 member 7-like n=1 Tax=Rhipicephalus microplus TaxID=6941 RepID=UPI003F6C4CF6
MSDPRQSPDNAGSPQPSSPSITPDNVQENNVGGTTPATETTTVFSSPMDQILIFGHGRFQKRVLFCTALAFFAAVTHVRTPAILARPVDHWCKPPTDYAYMTVGEWKNASVPLEADGKTRSACLRYDPPLPYSEDIENRTEVPCDAGWDYDVGADSGVISIVIEWNLVCGRRWILGVLFAVYLLAGAVGASLAGVAADAIGRRPVLCTCIFLVMFSGVSLAFARTVLAFAVLRVLLSASVSSVLVTSLVLLFEVTDTQHRALFCSLAMASPFFTAALYFELVYSLELSWYASQIAFMVPTGVLVLAVYMMDESPCWLLAVSNKRRAVQVLSWAARVNEVDPDVFNERLSELKAGLRKQREPQQASTPTDVSSPERGTPWRSRA